MVFGRVSPLVVTRNQLIWILALPRVVNSAGSMAHGRTERGFSCRSRGLYIHVLLIVLISQVFWGFAVFILFVLAWPKCQIFFILYSFIYTEGMDHASTNTPVKVLLIDTHNGYFTSKLNLDFLMA